MRLSNGTVRKKRRSSNVPGVAHEFTFSCYKGLPLLNQDRTRTWLADALNRTRKTWNVELWAYVVMPEHVHLLLLPCAHEYKIAQILQSIKQPVARRAMALLRRSQSDWLKTLRVPDHCDQASYHFWQPGGGYDRDIVSPAVAWSAIKYIHGNPVRRGLVDHPCDWQWSSARWYAGKGDVVLEMDDVPPEP
jgi:putative transposase